MSSALEHLVSLLKVTPIERDVYLGRAQDLGFGQLFGGHVLAQSLMAAAQTVESGRFCHSLHGYFLRLGKTDEPIYYEVDAIRSGQSFSTRRVVAKQGGVAIFTMSSSFQRAEQGFSHQNSMPSGITGPDGLVSELERIRSVKDKIPEKARESLTADHAIEIRVVDPVDYFAPDKIPAVKNSWFRTTDEVTDADPHIRHAILAYASDFGLASTAGMPHEFAFFKPGIQIASLDHSIWFHRPVNVAGWMLYEKDSPSAAGSRGFNRGQIFGADGALMASVAQESLIRTARKGR
jgi:acyl-CoA thioesterase-2